MAGKTEAQGSARNSPRVHGLPRHQHVRKPAAGSKGLIRVGVGAWSCHPSAPPTPSAPRPPGEGLHERGAGRGGTITRAGAFPAGGFCGAPRVPGGRRRRRRRRRQHGESGSQHHVESAQEPVRGHRGRLGQATPSQAASSALRRRRVDAARHRESPGRGARALTF